MMELLIILAFILIGGGICAFGIYGGATDTSAISTIVGAGLAFLGLLIMSPALPALMDMVFN